MTTEVIFGASSSVGEKKEKKRKSYTFLLCTTFADEESWKMCYEYDMFYVDIIFNIVIEIS